MQARNQHRLWVGAAWTSAAILTWVAGGCSAMPANVPATGNVEVAAAPTEAPADSAEVGAGEATTATQAQAAPAQQAPAADDEAAGRLHVPDGFALNTFIS